MKMVKKVCTFPNAMLQDMKKEAKQRQRRLKRNYAVTDFIRDSCEKELKNKEVKNV
jgi:hypothetical protein